MKKYLYNEWINFFYAGGKHSLKFDSLLQSFVDEAAFGIDEL